MGPLIPTHFSDDDAPLAFEEVIDEALKALPAKHKPSAGKGKPVAKKLTKKPVGSLAAYEMASEEDPWADALNPANLQRLERLRKALGIRDIAVFSTIDAASKKPIGKPKGTTFFLLDTQENLLALLDGPETKAAVRSLLAVPVKEQPKFAPGQRITWRELSRLLSMCFNAAEYADEDLPWFRFFPLPDPGSLEYYWYSIARGVWVEPTAAPGFELCRTDDVLEFGSSDGPSLIVPRGNPGLPAVFLSHGVGIEVLSRIEDCGAFLWPSLGFTWKIPPGFGPLVFLFDVRALANLLDPDATPDPRIVFAPTDTFTPSLDTIRRYQEAVNKELRGNPVYWKSGVSFETSYYRPLDAKQFLIQGYPEDHRVGESPALALSQERITTWKSLEMHLWKCLETHTKLPGGLFGYTHKGNDGSYGQFPYFELKIFASVPVTCATAILIPDGLRKDERKVVDRFLVNTGFQGKIIEVPDAPLSSSGILPHLAKLGLDRQAAWATGMTTKLLESPCDLSWVFWPRKGESLHECEVHIEPPTPKKKGHVPKKVGKKASHHAEMLAVSEHAPAADTSSADASIREQRDELFNENTRQFWKGWPNRSKGMSLSRFLEQPHGSSYYHMTYGRLLVEAARVSTKSHFIAALNGLSGIKPSDLSTLWDQAQVREGLYFTATFRPSGKVLKVEVFEGSFPDHVGELECTRLDSKEKWKFCADDIRELAHGQNLPVWETSVSGINADWIGQGAGSELYRYAIQALFEHEGPFFLVPNLCRNNYSTSDMAQLVWQRLHRDYPQHGEWAILVEDPAPDLHRDPLVQRFERESRNAIARTDTRGQLVLRESLPVRRSERLSTASDSAADIALYAGDAVKFAFGNHVHPEIRVAEPPRPGGAGDRLGYDSESNSLTLPHNWLTSIYDRGLSAFFFPRPGGGQLGPAFVVERISRYTPPKPPPRPRSVPQGREIVEFIPVLYLYVYPFPDPHGIAPKPVGKYTIRRETGILARRADGRLGLMYGVDEDYLDLDEDEQLASLTEICNDLYRHDNSWADMWAYGEPGGRIPFNAWHDNLLLWWDYLGENGIRPDPDFSPRIDKFIARVSRTSPDDLLARRRLTAIFRILRKADRSGTGSLWYRAANEMEHILTTGEFSENARSRLHSYEKLPARPRFGRLTANSASPLFPWDEDVENVFTLDGSSVTYTPEVMPPEVSIGRMDVPTGRRGQDLGRRLLSLLIAEIDERGLAARVVASPQDRDRFGYEDLGFEIVRGEGRPGKPVMRRPAQFNL